MPTLLELQRQMQAQLFGAPSDRHSDSASERIAIYRNTVAVTLVNALRLSFPAVQRIVGAEFFEAAAREFIREHAPHSAYLNDYGAQWPQFLASFGPAQSVSYLVDVARLEWAVNRALHAPDACALDVLRLSTAAETALPSIRLIAHPGLSVLQLRSPADTIWRAVLEQDSDAMAAVQLINEEPVHLLVERDRHGVQVRRLSSFAAGFTQRLSSGAPLHAALADYAALCSDSASPSEDVAALLAEHLAAGRFIDFSSTGST